MGSGLLEQIRSSNSVTYTSNFNIKELEKYLKDIQKLPQEREFSFLVGEYGQAVLEGNDKKVKELSHKYLLERIRKYKRLSVELNIDYDIIYMLSSLFKLEDEYSGKYRWKLEYNYLGDNEYDESSEYTYLIFKDGLFKINKYYSDGYYYTKLESSEDIDKNFLFDLILKYLKK
jgi:hypothetical protein